MSDRPAGDAEPPACPNCQSRNVERTPAMQADYRCLECGTEFDEGGRGVIAERDRP